VPGERILIIEDEEAIAELIAESLKRQGYQVLIAYDGDQGLDLAFETLPDLLILDLKLPKLDGWEICRRLKAERNTRDILILMLPARRDERDVIEGLELGADDYVSKPFSLSELSARIKALLRRSRRRSAIGAVLDIGPLKIDMEAQEATLNGNALDLSPTEYKLLEVLARNEGRTLSRDELLAKVWGTHARRLPGLWMCTSGGCATNWLTTATWSVLSKPSAAGDIDSVSRGKSVRTLKGKLSLFGRCGHRVRPRVELATHRRHPARKSVGVESTLFLAINDHGGDNLILRAVGGPQYSASIDGADRGRRERGARGSHIYSPRRKPRDKKALGEERDGSSDCKVPLSTLQMERDDLASILETLPIGVMVTDEHGRLRYANSALERFLNLSREWANKPINGPVEPFRTAGISRRSPFGHNTRAHHF
jgi:two-component system phosphate regulon response regulator PhoB/two-component system alkaline phosphatase synthesis response regulator PhoP